ncbi:MAG TPA: CHRD domain-containing protein [Candidatus Dormibacteraeota bacterium]|nr:CHRD domain-containing protein [Candidatus Dormibacteraeota bacterium]
MRRAKLSIAILAASVLLLTASIGVASAHPTRILVQVVQLSGDKEVWGTPPTCLPPDVCGDPDARGLAIIVIIPALDLVCWHLSWRNIDGFVTAAHIHGPATTVQAAPVLVPLSVNPVRGCTQDAALGATLDAIVATPSMYYVNIHSSPLFGPGAIRGQLR